MWLEYSMVCVCHIEEAYVGGMEGEVERRKEKKA